MTVPSKLDIKKREDKLQTFLKRLNEDGSPQEKHVVSVVRSAIRSAWMKSDVKLAYLYMNTVPDMDDSTRTKWLCKCEICGGMFKLTDIEIDHKTGNHSFTKVDDFRSYFDNILMVGFDDLQALCVECHSCKSLSERLGISFTEASYHKQAIALAKSKQDSAWLKDRGIQPASNAAKRREQVVNKLREEDSDGTTT